MLGNKEKTPISLALSVKNVIYSGIFEEIIAALNDKKLTSQSGISTIAKLASGRSNVYDSLTTLISIWKDKLPNASNEEYAFQINSIKEAITLSEKEATRIELVWTGPKIEGSYLRATRQVIQDIIYGAKRELLVVGYWLSAKEDQEGIVSEIIELIANAVDKGIKVVIILDEGEKGYGKNNRNTLISLWPKNVCLPELLTWEIPRTDSHLKLHAKVLVADRFDALITSANLTMYALDRNIEMGVRLQGIQSEIIQLHFDLLKEKRILVEYSK
jgi:cardiolipin synthase